MYIIIGLITCRGDDRKKGKYPGISQEADTCTKHDHCSIHNVDVSFSRKKETSHSKARVGEFTFECVTVCVCAGVFARVRVCLTD